MSDAADRADAVWPAVLHGEKLGRGNDALQRRANFVVHHAEEPALRDEGLLHRLDRTLAIVRCRSIAAPRPDRVQKPERQRAPAKRKATPDPPDATGHALRHGLFGVDLGHAYVARKLAQQLVVTGSLEQCEDLGRFRLGQRALLKDRADTALKLRHPASGVHIARHCVQKALDLGGLGKDADPGSKHRSAAAQLGGVDGFAGGDCTQLLLEPVVRYLILSNGPVEAFVGNGIGSPGDRQLLADQGGRGCNRCQQHKRRYGPPAKSLRRGYIARAAAAC